MHVYIGIGKVTGVTVFCGPVGLIIQCAIGWDVSENVIYVHVHICMCTYVCV